MKEILRISQYMTPTPRTVDIAQNLEQASDYMRKLRVRHLPVTKGGKPIGIITERDIGLALVFANLDAFHIKVESALTPMPYMTSPERPVSEVLEHMRDAKLGCVLVTEYQKLVGIFTTIDALRALSDMFKRVRPNLSPDPK